MDNYGIVYTKQDSFLLSCIETGSYGQSIHAINSRGDGDLIGGLRNIELGDRIFLNYGNIIICGPFIITTPHENFITSSRKGHWYFVDSLKSTPPTPVWIGSYPWCIFFEKMLLSQAKYIWYKDEYKNGFGLPYTFIELLNKESGKNLWEYIEEYGGSFSDFIQRNRSFMVKFHTPFLTPEKSYNNVIYAQTYKTRTGAMVRSRGEYSIANILDDHKIRFYYEKAIIIDGYLLHPDFYLPENDLIIEYLGLYESNSNYRDDWEWKENLYMKNNKKYITIKNKDFIDLESNLLKKISRIS
jgi:hypothetical protein